MNRLFLFLILIFAGGCATYQTKVGDARRLIAEGKAADAAKILEPEAHKDSRDQLVYQLDYATALQQAGDFKGSAKEFAAAEKVADVQDYHSISKISESLLLSEEMKQYKGDAYEKVLINAINAINYLELGELDDALVEVRRLNEKLYKYKYEAKRDYEQNPYAFYISAMIWEAGGRWDDSYIDYKKAYELAPSFRPLREDLIRLATKAQRSDDLKDWHEKFPEVKPKSEWRDPSLGELVLIYQQGWGPRKGPRRGAPRFPELFPVPTVTQRALMRIESGPVVGTSEIYSVQDVAIKTLDNDYGALVAGRVAGVVTKAVVADQVRQKNELLGALAFIALNATDRADVRQWSTLPQTFQIAKTFLKAGKYKVTVDGQTGSGTPSGESLGAREISIRPGHTTFITWRSFK